MMAARRLCLLALLSLAPWPALAQPEGRGQGQGRGQGGGQGQGGGPPPGRGNQGDGGRGQGGGSPGRGGPPASLGAGERDTIRLWLGGNPGFVAQPLPPGMRNRLAQGKPLPPGIARRAVPPDLLRLLPVRPGYEYVMIGTSLVLIAVATGVVASILADVF
jgi:hypothetical protein